MSEEPWFKPKRKHDEVIGGEENPYIQRWYLARKSSIKVLENLYLHKILRGDDDRALHDHPWWNISLILRGGYWEHMPVNRVLYAARLDMRTRRVWRGPGRIVLRRADDAHRLELPEGGKPCWSLFLTGQKSREWGFYCPTGWRHNETFDMRGCD